MNFKMQNIIKDKLPSIKRLRHIFFSFLNLNKQLSSKSNSEIKKLITKKKLGLQVKNLRKLAYYN